MATRLIVAIILAQCFEILLRSLMVAVFSFDLSRPHDHISIFKVSSFINLFFNCHYFVFLSSSSLNDFFSEDEVLFSKLRSLLYSNSSVFTVVGWLGVCVIRRRPSSFLFDVGMLVREFDALHRTLL